MKQLLFRNLKQNKTQKFLFLFLLLFASAVFAQIQPAEGKSILPEEGISEEQVQAFRKLAAEAANLDEETRQKLLGLYDEILTTLAQNKEIQTQIESYRRMQNDIPNTIEQTRQALVQMEVEPPMPAVESMTTAELEKRLTAAQLALEEARKNDERIQQESLRRARRRTQIPEEVNTFQQQLEQMKLQYIPSLSPFHPTDLVQVSGLLRQVQLDNLRLRIELLEEEDKAYAACEPLLTLQRDLSSRQLAAAERRFRFWEEAVQEARLQEIEQIQARAEQTARLAEGAHPVVRRLTLENAQLARLQTERVHQIEKAADYALTIEAKLREISKDFDNIQAQIAHAGQVTGTLGVLLLTKKNDLPDLRQYQKQIRQRMDESTALQLEWSKYDQQWSALSDLRSQAARQLLEAGLSPSDPDYPMVFQQTVRLLEEQRQLLQGLAGYTMKYLTALAHLDIQERTLVSTVRRYQRFIDENSFWVKNFSLLRPDDFRLVLPVLREWIQPHRWRQIVSAFWQDLRTEWIVYLVFLGCLGTLVRWCGWMKRTCRKLTENVSRIETDRYVYTLYTLLLSVLLALPWPLGFMFFWWRLREGAVLAPEAVSLAEACYETAVRLFVYKIIVLFCSPGGLGEHFQLPADFLRAFRRHAAWYFQIVIPLTFASCLVNDPAIEETARNAVLRFLFLGRQILLMVFLVVLFRPSGVLIRSYLEKSLWLKNLMYVCYGLCWAVPLFFCYLSIVGYGYTAEQLHQRLLTTLVFLLAVFFLYGMLMRWLQASRNLLVYTMHLQSLEPVSGQVATASISEGISAGKRERQEQRLNRMSRQSRKLINTLTFLLILAGVFWIWRSVLPALGVLDKVHLWTSVDAKGQPKIVTLAGVFWAIFITVLTVILTRNIPGFLEVSILRRFPFDAGMRFAITSITRYVLVIVGIILVSAQLGIRWSAVQWLVAALSVGLGIGLQEVFANFVCGLLLLFERPLRVGDVVTVGDVTGKVTRIQIRATTIQLWDRKELVVPNRELITGQLVNWTLSDTVQRLIFPIGVAYGSDIKKVEDTLYRVAAAHPKVLHDKPAPFVVFDSFGDSALLFELRLYIPSMDFLSEVKHQINCAIDEEFRKEGIEIAFPQRDLHIRTIQAPLSIQQEAPRQG